MHTVQNCCLGMCFAGTCSGQTQADCGRSAWAESRLTYNAHVTEFLPVEYKSGTIARVPWAACAQSQSDAGGCVRQ